MSCYVSFHAVLDGWDGLAGLWAGCSGLGQVLGCLECIGWWRVTRDVCAIRNGGVE